MKEENNIEVKQTNSADYKPEEVEYKDVEHNNSSTLINAFMDNNTVEESKEHDIEVEELTKQQEQQKEIEEVKKIEEVEVPKFCKTMNTVMISSLTFAIISFFFTGSKSLGKVIDVFGFILSISIIPVNLFAIIEEIVLLRGKSEEEKSAIMFYIILNISILVFFFIYLVFCFFSIDNSFNMQGLG